VNDEFWRPIVLLG